MQDENLEPLTPFARTIVELEQHRPDPTDVPEEKLLARLSETLGFEPPPPPPVANPQPSRVVAPRGAGMLSKTLIGGMLISAGALVGGGTVYWWMSGSIDTLVGKVQALEAEARTVRDLPAPAPEPKRIEPPAPIVELPIPVPPPKLHKETARPKVDPALEVDSLNDENVLVERARTALLRSEPAGALVALDQHAQIHPKGRLSEERDALRVQVLIQLHRRAEALEVASEFRRKHPKSLLLPSVEAALESSP